MAKSSYYQSDHWKNLRTQALRRDNYTCQICRRSLWKKGSRPTVDHIKPRGFSDAPTRADVIGNLQTLCPGCSNRKTQHDGSYGEPKKPLIQADGFPEGWAD